MRVLQILQDIQISIPVGDQEMTRLMRILAAHMRLVPLRPHDLVMRFLLILRLLYPPVPSLTLVASFFDAILLHGGVRGQHHGPPSIAMGIEDGRACDRCIT